jgi:ABC-type uncharacterized transport system permease subunit
VFDWPFRLEKRPRPSATMRVVAPAVATLAMVLTGFVAFALLGKNPLAALQTYFVSPISSAYGIGELLLKATPLLMCALGLAIGFKADVWNIGAEGQLPWALSAVAEWPCSGDPRSDRWRFRQCSSPERSAARRGQPFPRC